MSELDVFAAYFEPDKPLYFDTETTGLNPRTDKLVAIILWQEAVEPLIVDCRHIPWGDIAAVLRGLFGRATRIVGHNLKFDLSFLLSEGIAVEGKRVWDTKIAEQLIVGMGGSDAAAKGIQFTLAATYAHHTGKQMSKEERNWFIDLDIRVEQVLGDESGATYRPWDEPFPQDQLRYMALDVQNLAPIYAGQLKRVEELGLRKVAGLEMRVVPALAAMEMAGVRIDVEGWRAVIAEKSEQAKALEAQALEYFAHPILLSRLHDYDAQATVLEQWEVEQAAVLAGIRAEWEAGRCDSGVPWGEYKQRELAGWKLHHPRPKSPKADTSLPNINSSDQLLAAFRVMGIQAASTDSEVLGQIDHEAVRALLAYRKAVKFAQSFGENLLAKVEADGRIHPNYQQIGASTGRMSCTDPNWQQVPARGDGARLRACVVPEPGNVLVTADFSNIELRILAALSADPTLIEWFEQGLDMHAELAYRVFKLDRSVDVAKAEFTPGLSYRQLMKTINYGLVYGMSAMKLSRTAKVPVDRAEAIMEDYFRELPGVQKWLSDQRAKALQGEEPITRTRSGRIRRYHVTTAELRADRRALGRVQRQAMNSPIQGLSADITKLAVAFFHERTDIGRLVAVVHDELVVECPEADADRAAAQLEQAMDDAQRFFVKLPQAALPRPHAVISNHWEH